MSNLIYFGIALLWVLLFLFIRFRKRKTCHGRAEAVVIRRDPPFSVRPHRARLIFEYEVDGVTYRGSTPRVNGKDELHVGDKLMVQYKTEDPKKYYCE